MSDLKQGDVVQLKSGGPTMTIQEIADYSIDESGILSADCIWFDGKKPISQAFNLQTLVKIES